ncbi:MAG TPA: hypothetical protein VK281_15525 [Xanthobacteraceae bacterium]|nr:hypothetical protein [Xanthobacteraceae bacterium]
MKRILLVSSCLILLPTVAVAADYAVPVAIPKAPVAAPVASSWTGGYIGAQVGYSFGDNVANFTFFPDVPRAVRASGNDQPAIGRRSRWL